MTLLDLDLTGKVALVTASTSGIGLSTSVGLAKLGASVWMNGRRAERLETAAASVRDQVPGADVHTVVADVATAQGCASVVETVEDVDILINMAGGTDKLGPFVELTDEDWQQQWDFNVMSAVRLTRHYVPLLLQKDFGRIIFMTSEAGIVTPANVINYGTCKAAVIRLSRAIAELFAQTNVTVNCVAPGPTISEWLYRTAGGTPMDEFAREFLPKAQPTSLMDRFAEADEVANLVLYLCTPASAATRGALLRAEGGSVRTS